MAQPSDTPNWSTSGTKTEPSAPKQAQGWLVGEKVPAQWLNWWMNLVYQWIVYLKNLSSEAFTWTAAHTFESTLDVEDTLFAHGGSQLQGFFKLSYTDESNTAGPITIGNQVCGTARIPAGASSLVINASQATGSQQTCLVSIAQATEDATLTRVRAVVSSGVITVYGNANATAHTKFSWLLLSA